MLVSEIISAAARKLGVIASGENLTPNEQADFLFALQVMLRSWAAEKLHIFATTKENFTLISGTGSYTWGSGGDISSARPNKLLGAFIVDGGGTTHTVDIIDSSLYNSISVKGIQDRPYKVFPQYSYPLAVLYFYPIPNTAEVITLESIKPFTETSSFDAATSTISFPAAYEEAIIYNLSVRLASEFGKTLPLDVAALARSSYDRIILLNAQNYVTTVNIDLPVRDGNGYNINTNLYR